MKHAIDLNPRQAARVFEQATRSHATILLEPSVWGYFDGLKGFIASGDERTVMVEITESPPQPLEGLRGLYCDAELLLSGHRYMFCSDIVEVVRLGEGTQTLVLSRPATLQVAQRRRFWRADLAEPSSVWLASDGPEGQRHMASVYNISQDGMACRADVAASDVLLIGDTVDSSFDLPRCPRHFKLKAVVCNKTPAADEGKVILGLQFVRDQADREASESLRILTEFLAEFHQGALQRGEP